MASDDAQQPDHQDCLNCGARLRGQFCSHCGQRASGRLISLWELLRDAFGDLFELDSRLWRTLIPLLISPGKLTQDYLEGRRARYMPPFRMYLVLSIIFFAVAFFDPQDELGLLFEPETNPAAQGVTDQEQARADAQDVLDELRKEGILPEGDAVPAQETPASAEEGNGSDSPEASSGLNLHFTKDTDKCTITGHDSLPGWLGARLTRERLEAACDRIRSDNGKTLLKLLLDNIPVALIVLLPFMALVLKGLYPLSRRFFVEHLLFFVHFHAFFFLILTLQILFSRLARLVALPEIVSTLVILVASFYIPVYLYKAMRRVYGQGRVATLGKFLALTVAYYFGAAMTMLGALLFALLSV